MPRFFFDTYDGETFVTDHEGMDLGNIEAAKVEARKALPDMISDPLPDGNYRSFVVSVRDGSGQVALRLALSLIVEEGHIDD